MATIQKLRRTYFALCKELGLGDDLRHEFTEAVTGKESTKDWLPADWRRAIAGLQHDAGVPGVDPDGPPHLRAEGPEDERDGVWATQRQAALVETIASEINWDELQRGPRQMLLTTVLKRDELALRRMRVERSMRHIRPGDDTPLCELAMILTRKECSNWIAVLRKLRMYHPLDGRVGVA